MGHVSFGDDFDGGRDVPTSLDIKAAPKLVFKRA